jgi:hypothetical protein
LITFGLELKSGMKLGWFEIEDSSFLIDGLKVQLFVFILKVKRLE